MKHSCYQCVLAVLLLIPSFVFASESSVEKFVLDNGLTVLIEPMASVETVSIYAYVKTGSSSEGQYLGMGISHFLEHMLFKGTTKRKVGEIAREVASLGGEINAHTSLDYTMYTLDLPKDRIGQGVDIIADMLMNSAIDAVQIENERPVIHGEMRLYADRPERVLSHLVFKNAYMQHPYRHQIIGYKELFDQVNRESLYQYYKTHYTPNNIIISIAGGINKDDAIALVKETFKNFKSLPFIDRNLIPEPPQISARYLRQEYATNLYRFSLSFQGVAMLDPDLYAMDVLAMALGQGRSSRLYRQVYEKQQLVNSISASNFTPQDRGIFEIEAQLSKDNVEEAVKSIIAVINGIKRQGLTTEELDRAKRKVLAQFIYSNQTSHGLAYRNAVDMAMTGDVNFARYYVDAVKGLTNKDMKRVANKYLNKQQSSLVVLAPRQEKIQEKVIAEESKVLFHKTILDNGLTLLLQENHRSPTVSIQLVMNAGTRQEPVFLNGLSALTAQVWEKSTQVMNATQLASALESRAIGLDVFAGRNTLGLKMDMLSDDIEYGLNVLTDIVTRPVFESSMIEQQRQQILAAIDARNDDVPAVTFKELVQTLFLTHPFRLDNLGSKETVLNITQRDITHFYKQFASPKNMVISIVGDFKSPQVLAQLKNKLSTFKGAQVALNQFTEGLPTELRRNGLTLDKEQAMLAIGFRAPLLKDRDRFTMNVIDAILGNSLSGRLFVKVRDELGKAYTVGSSYVPGVDAGMFGIHVLTTPEKVLAVEGIIKSEIELLRTVEVSTTELNAVKNYLKGSFAMGLDAPQALASMSSLDELYGLGFDAYTHYNEHIDAVTSVDVLRVSRQYLDFNRAAMVVTNAKK